MDRYDKRICTRILPQGRSRSGTPISNHARGTDDFQHHPFSEFAQGLRRVGQHELLPRFETDISVDYKPDGSVITQADCAVDSRVRALLREHGVDEPVLSEEQTHGEQARVLESASAFWMLDPLDGTSNFAGGMPFFAISIARIEGDRVTHGATYDPVRDELFSATADGPFELNGAIPRVCGARRLPNCARPWPWSTTSASVCPSRMPWCGRARSAPSATWVPVPWSGPGWPPDGPTSTCMEVRRPGTAQPAD